MIEQNDLNKLNELDDETLTDLLCFGLRLLCAYGGADPDDVLALTEIVALQHPTEKVVKAA